MIDDFSAPGQMKLRGADSNTLLRMYDVARERSARSPSQGERDRASKAVERIAKELRRQGVRT
jgi:hypothetical protein